MRASSRISPAVPCAPSGRPFRAIPQAVAAFTASLQLLQKAVLCVHDRRRTDVHLGVFLQHDRRRRFLGCSPCLGEYQALQIGPAVPLAARQLHIGRYTVQLPLLRRGRQHIVAGTGFAVAGAVALQRLWVVESR